MRHTQRAAILITAAAGLLAAAAGPVLAAGSAAAVRAPQGGSVVGFGEIDSISCPSAGNCAAVGSMSPPSRKVLFVVSEKHGTWGTAKRIPGPAPARKPDSEIDLVTCPSAGNCSASGSASGPRLSAQVFLVSQKNGAWGNAGNVNGIAP